MEVRKFLKERLETPAKGFRRHVEVKDSLETPPSRPNQKISPGKKSMNDSEEKIVEEELRKHKREIERPLDSVLVMAET